MSKDNNRKGIALIIVLFTMVIISILALSAVTLSQISLRTSTTSSSRTAALYMAEGVSARVQWMIMSDKKQYSNRSMGTEAIGEEDRYLADGRIHKIDYYGSEVTFVINDMVSGMDLARRYPQELKKIMQRSLDDPEKTESINRFSYLIKDYIDKDDFLSHSDSMEFPDYNARGFQSLPRNGQIKFKEEFLFIPGIEKIVSIDNYGRLSDIQIVPLPKMRHLPSRSSFFSTSRNAIEISTNLTDSQIDEVIAAKESWVKEGIPLNDKLDPLIMTQLRSKFSFRESGFYTIIVKASNGENAAPKIMINSLQIDRNTFSRPVQYYEWMLF